MAEYSFAKVTTPAFPEISLESPWDVQSWEQLNASKGNSNDLFFNASTIKDIIPAHIIIERKHTSVKMHMSLGLESNASSHLIEHVLLPVVRTYC